MYRQEKAEEDFRRALATREQCAKARPFCHSTAILLRSERYATRSTARGWAVVHGIRYIVSILFILGVVMGSFYNVVIHRIPKVSLCLSEFLLP